MQSLDFTPAVQPECHARVGLIGVSGSGKTYTALRLAQGFGGRKVGVIDTDRSTALKYAREFAFHHLPMHVYDPADLTRAVAVAADAGVDVLVVDTASPFWSGAEGMLEQVDKATSSANSRDKFGVGWNVMRPVERAMLEALAHFPGHLIVTVKAKTEYLVEVGPDGRARPRRIGTRPEQRDGFESEFDVVLDLADGVGTVTKTRCRELRGVVVDEPGEALAELILGWLGQDARTPVFNAVAERDWALRPERSDDELHQRMRELEAMGRLQASVIGPNGLAMSLHKVFWLRRKDLERAAEQGGAPQP